MRRSCFLIIFCWLLGWPTASRAGVYKLIEGEALRGDPISYNETGLIVRQSDGTVSTRTPWAQFSQEALKQLMAEAKTPKDKSYVEPFVEEVAQQEAKRKEIVVKQVEPPPRPTGRVGFFAGFSSPVFVVIFLITYFANIYAAYEIAFFKNFSPAMVCGVAAVVPWIGPTIFICVPKKPDPMHGELYESVESASHEEVATGEPIFHHQTAAPGDTTVESNPLAPIAPSLHPHVKLAVAPPTEPAVALPAPMIFRRGEFSFNRRFFETKLAGFFRLVPGDTEKDMVIVIKSARGEFTGKRITRVTQTELYLQVFKENVTHDEMIPFTEVQEVIIQHKEL